MPKEFYSSDVGDCTSLLSNVFEKIVAGKLNHISESNSLLSPSQFSYRRGLGTCDALIAHILSHDLQNTLDRGTEGRLVQLDVSVAFHRVSHRGLLHKLRSKGRGEQFFSIVLELSSLVIEAPAALGYWLDIPFVFPRSNWNVATASIFGKLRRSFM